MTSLFYYLIQVIVSSGILYLYYHFFLRNKRFHQYNRFYLLGTVILSIIIPFLRIPVYFTHEDSASSIVLRTLTILGPSNEEIPWNTGNLSALQNSSHYTIDLIYCLYAVIACLALGKIIIGLVRIKTLGKRNPSKKLGNIFFINTSDSHAPFSFFNRLFWHRDIELKSEKGEQIFRHELFHIRQRHSIDIVFMELVSMVFWINPFFHLIKKEMRAIHEFLADRYALDKCNQWNYAETLLMHAFQTKQSLVNPFFHNQIKRRIAMITNPKKTSHQYLRKVLVLPVAVVIVTLFAFSYRKNNPTVTISKDMITVVVDAGHGGDDPGVQSPDGKYRESELALSITKMIQRLAPEYNINVLMTRKDANYPGGAADRNQGLMKRVEITNEINPSAFISIHINNSGIKGFQNKNSGIEAYVTNKREDDPGKAAASAILQELSSVYKTSSDLKYRENLGIYVLDKNKCASVILECGYMNNRQDLDFITNEANQEKMARAILKGLVNFNKSLAFQAVPALQTIDTLPHSYTIDGKIDFAGGITFKAENITVKTNEVPSGQSFNPKLIVLNGSLLTQEDAKNTFKNATVRNAEIQILAPNNGEAIGKYGERAREGVIVIENAVMEKKEPKLLKNLTLNGVEGDPLFILDGKVLAREDAEKTMRSLDPNTIESINILKDKSATTLYGEKGKNGVIQIITKKKKYPSSAYLQPGDSLIVREDSPSNVQ
jgi:TonB-dependent SusC/RagA subfamily outer membrane receptor